MKTQHNAPFGLSPALVGLVGPVACVIGSLALGALFYHCKIFRAAAGELAAPVVAVAVAVAALCLVVSGLFPTEKSTDPTPAKDGCFSAAFYSFRPSTVRANPYLYTVAGCFALLNLSAQTILPYLILYGEKTLGIANFSLLSVPAVLLAAGVAAYYGTQYDRLGFNSAVRPTIYLQMAGYLLLFFGRGPLPIFLGTLLMLTGTLGGAVVFGKLLQAQTPHGKARQFRGLRIAAGLLLPGILGPCLGAAVLHNAALTTGADGTASFLPNRNLFIASFAVAIALLVALQGLFAVQRGGHWPLCTPAGEAFAQNPPRTPWAAHPHPQLRRASYYSLNGTWQLNGSPILVPFPPESDLSGYGKRVKPHLTYERTFTLPDGFTTPGGRVLLHFGAVDQTAAVSVNGHPVARHEGGYLPFEADITDSLTAGENRITVAAVDTLSPLYPYGKQRKKRGGMWYTPVSGIWQSVWLECVPAVHIQSISVTPDLDGITLRVHRTDPATSCTAVVELGSAGRLTAAFTGESTRITLRGATPDGGGAPITPTLWTPETPHLYPLTLTCGADTIESYFALRTITMAPDAGGQMRICLNGKPVFLHGVLDQGYYPEGLFLPADEEGYTRDVQRMKDLGFNMLRKHIKVEPEAFYAACDRLGMLVVQDMVNNGAYHFISDTVLPTLGRLERAERRPFLPAEHLRRAFFEQHSRQTLAHLYNHPCVVGYTVFNEGWGQFDSDRITVELKAIDPTRFYDSTSGWFSQMGSDLESRHIYFKSDPPVPSKKLHGKPMFLSEFGGYAYPLEGHIYSKYASFGYGVCPDAAALTESICTAYRTMVAPAIPHGLCGCVYTQLCDVEDEINGLYTYDRRVCKPDAAALQALAAELYAASERCGTAENTVPAEPSDTAHTHA